MTSWPVFSRTRSIASLTASTWSVRSRSRPPGSRSGWPKSTTQMSRPSSCSVATADARGETSQTSVVSISGGIEQRSARAGGGVVGEVVPQPVVQMLGLDACTARTPRRSRGRRSAPPRRRCAPWPSAAAPPRRPAIASAGAAGSSSDVSPTL